MRSTKHRSKRRSCALCKPHKMGHEPKDTARHAAEEKAATEEIETRRHQPATRPQGQRSNMRVLSIEQIAEICHEANRALCKQIGDDSQKPWAEAPAWQRDSVIHGVEFHISSPYVSASASHDSWMTQKIEDGWVYGSEKDEEAKTHHCLVPLKNLPPEQQLKDYLFAEIVRALTALDD